MIGQLCSSVSWLEGFFSQVSPPDAARCTCALWANCLFIYCDGPTTCIEPNMPSRNFCHGDNGIEKVAHSLQGHAFLNTKKPFVQYSAV